MSTYTFECQKCHCRKRTAFASSMPCPRCGVYMQNVTGKALVTYECMRCRTRKRTSFASGMTCPKCNCMMTRVS